MKLVEFIEDTDIETAVYDPSRDRINARSRSDTRKPKLTLMTLNRLKKLRALRKLEAFKRQDLLAVMYGQPSEEQGGGGFGF